MRIEIEIAFSFKRELSDDHRFIDLPEGANIESAMREFVKRHPGAEDRLFDRSGGILRHINALVNGGNVTLRQGFQTVLLDGDRLTLLPPVGGG